MQSVSKGDLGKLEAVTFTVTYHVKNINGCFSIKQYLNVVFMLKNIKHSGPTHIMPKFIASA
jgi:hypothetical protein